MKPEAIQFTAIAPTITLDRESRTIRGKITAYGVPTSDYRRIVMHDGALRPRMPLSRVKMLIDHDQRQPVGFMTELDGKAHTAAFSIPEGAAGDQALSDAENGLRDGLSVGINVLNEEGAFTYDEESRTYNVYAAELVEVSLCAIPAYQDSQVTHVAASFTPAPPTPKETTVDPEEISLTRDDLDQALSAQAETFGRELDTRLAVIADAAPTSGPTWPTFGAFVKDLAAGDTLAADFYQALAYDGATTADDKARNAWVDDAIHLVAKNRKVLNSFTLKPLPEKGMTLEYLKLESNTMAVGKQAAQGDNLVKGKIKLTSATTPIDTYGGYTELTRQIIDRAEAPYVDTAFTAMDLEYARATEGFARATVKALVATRLAAADHLTVAADADAYEWLDLIVDASLKFDDDGYALDGSYVSVDVFKKLIRLEDTNGNSLMRVWGQGMNQVGQIDARQVTGELASVQFKILPDAEANTLAFYDSLAVTFWESPGAPFQLNDENVVNLTEAFSKYGYLAGASQFPDAMTSVQIGAGA